MKNFKKLSKESLKAIQGGFRICPLDRDCGSGWCCVNGSCRTIEGASPSTYLCTYYPEY